MGSKASRARGGARLAGRAGRLPARGSPGPALWGSAAEAPAHCTLRPLPDYRAGPRGARAGGGGASGSGARPVSARARRRGRRPCPSRPGARGPSRAGASGPGTPIRTPTDSSRGVHVDPGPRRDGSQFPARGGGGAANRFPFFCSSKPGEVIAQRGGGRKNPGFRVSRPPPSLLGRGRGGTPCPSPPLPPWIWQPLTLRGAGEALRPRPQLIWGSRRRPPSRTPQEYLLPSDLSPGCCSARPFGSQGGAQREPGLSRPHLAFGSMVSGAPWRVP